MRHPDPLLEVIEAWQPLLPDFIINNILEQMVLPSLTSEVELWNPLTDTMPIHAWIHPWLPLMSQYSFISSVPSLLGMCSCMTALLE